MTAPRPGLPAWARKNYVLLAPVATHWRPATCAEVDCDRWVNGFEVHCDVSDVGPLGGAERAVYLRDWRTHGRTRFTEYRADGSTIVVFRFEPGQKPWGDEHGQHRIRLDRPAVCAVKDPFDGPRLHDGPEGGAVNWVDDFANHQDQLATEQAKG